MPNLVASFMAVLRNAYKEVSPTPQLNSMKYGGMQHKKIGKTKDASL